MRKIIYFGALLLLFILLPACSLVHSKEEMPAYVSVLSESNYTNTFKSLRLGELFHYNLKLNHADQSWVRIWAEGYPFDDSDPILLAELNYGLHPSKKVNEGNLVFGMINPTSENTLLFLSAPGAGSTPRPLPQDFDLHTGMNISHWTYAIHGEPVGLDYGEEKILGYYQQLKSRTFRPIEPENIEVFDRMLKEDRVIVLKIQVTKHDPKE